MLNQGDLYVAVLVYESSSPAPSYRALYEETFLLVRGGTEEQARQRARRIATDRATEYHNENGEKITWHLKHIVDVMRVLDDSLDDGSEIYCRFFRNYADYWKFNPLLSGEDITTNQGDHHGRPA